MQTHRFDTYSQAHKGVRAFLTATMQAVGELDCTDDGSVKEVLDLVDELLVFCDSHVKKEDEYVHAAIAERAPEHAAAFAAAHAGHAAATKELRALTHEVACASGAAREAAAARLYRELARFVAGELEHMAHEETAHNAILWGCFGDDELAAIHASIVAASTPQDLAWAARWMIPHLTPAERHALLAGARATLPADAFDAVVALARPHLPASQWQRLGVELGLTTGRDLDRKDVAARFLDATFVRFDADAAAALVTRDFVAHPWVGLGLPPGPAGLAPVIAALRAAFGGARATLHDVLVEGSKVAVRYEYAGVHVGELFGIAATGRSFRFSGIAILRITDGGEVAEYWREEDVMTLQRQLGLASPVSEQHGPERHGPAEQRAARAAT